MNLFLVTSPFQYMCACEAKAHYKTSNNILLLVNQVSVLGISQQNKLISTQDWEHIITIPRKNRTQHIPKVIKRIKKLLGGKELQHFFHAEYNGWRTKILLRNLPILKEVYFDDGTLTINEYEEFIRNKRTFHRSRPIQDILLKLRGCKPIGVLPQSNNLEVFTIFDINKPEHNVVKNSFEVLRMNFEDKKVYNPLAPIGFIGQGAIGHKRRKTVSEYVKEIKKLITSFDSDVIYFPHRTESNEVHQKLKEIPRLHYHQSTLPLELEIVEQGIELSKFIGIFSTAQYTYKILDPELPVFNAISPKTASLMTERSKRIHQAFQKIGIKDLSLL